MHFLFGWNVTNFKSYGVSDGVLLPENDGYEGVEQGDDNKLLVVQKINAEAPSTSHAVDGGSSDQIAIASTSTSTPLQPEK